MIKIALLILFLYSKVISPILHYVGKSVFGSSFACRFTPTCSEYSHQAIKQYGIITGLRMSLLRYLRCNPFSQGGFDPVPLPSTKLPDKIK